MALSIEEKELFGRLISNLQLANIQPIGIQSERPGFGPVPGYTEADKNIVLAWNQAFATDDPLRVGEGSLFLRPRYEFSISLGGNQIFKHVSTFGILFKVIDEGAFELAWACEPVKKLFLEKQVMKTMWPLLRQQTLDGMSRLCLPTIPLPWIVE